MMPDSRPDRVDRVSRATTIRRRRSAALPLETAWPAPRRRRAFFRRQDRVGGWACASRHRDDLRVRAPPANLADGFDPFFLRHDQIGDHQGGPLRLEQGQSSLAVLGLDDGMLGGQQHAADQRAHGRGVIDDQNQRHRFQEGDRGDRGDVQRTRSALSSGEGTVNGLPPRSWPSASGRVGSQKEPRERQRERGKKQAARSAASGRAERDAPKAPGGAQRPPGSGPQERHSRARDRARPIRRLPLMPRGRWWAGCRTEDCVRR